MFPTVFKMQQQQQNWQMDEDTLVTEKAKD